MAIQLPNGKISRTLPEQVGFNSAKIEEIIKAINDFELQDKVVNLEDSSGILSDSQFATAELSPSYVVYNGKVFIKALEDSTYIDFIEVGALAGGSTSLTLSVERVRITISSKAYQYAVVQLFESYTKAQIDTLLAAKANLSGATFTGKITAPVIEQSAATWGTDITLTRDGSGTVTLTQQYCRLEVIGNMLFLVVNFSLANEGDSTVSMGTVKSSQIELPESIAEKIYDFKNNPLTTPAGVNKEYLIAMQNANVVTSADNFYYEYNLALSPKMGIYHVGNTTPNLVRVYITRNSTNDVNIPANTTWYFTARLFLTLL